MNPSKKITYSCSRTVSIIIAFWIYASFTSKRRKVVFRLDTHSTGQINLAHKCIASLNEENKMQNPPSPFDRLLFSQKSSIIFDWVLNTLLINYLPVLTLTSVLSFKLLSFDFLLKEILTLKPLQSTLMLPMSLRKCYECLRNRIYVSWAKVTAKSDFLT